MSIQLGDTAPDFKAQSTEGEISFHDWMGDNWAVLFSHPKDFTPVCTTELGAVARLKPEFQKRGIKIIGLSVDGVAESFDENAAAQVGQWRSTGDVGADEVAP